MKKIWPLIFALIALLIGTFFDLQISQYLVQNNVVADFFERYIMFGLALIFMYGCAVQFITRKNIIYLIIGFSVGVVNGLFVAKMAYQGNYVIDLVGSILGVLIILGLFILYLKNMDQYHLKKLANFYRIFIFVYLSTVVITFVLKGIWGRIIYEDLMAISDFKPWYVFGYSENGTSFPSAHTAIFSSIVCFFIHPSLKANPSKIIKTLLVLLIIVMPIMRIISGAHYLSDTAVGFLITYLLFLLYHNLFRNRRR